MATRSRSNFFGDFLFCEKKVTATGVGSHPEGDQKKHPAEGSQTKLPITKNPPRSNEKSIKNQNLPNSLPFMQQVKPLINILQPHPPAEQLIHRQPPLPV